MKKRIYFANFDEARWPPAEALSPYFLTQEGRTRFFASDNDNWGLCAEGVDGTELLVANRGRVDVCLTIQGDRSHGILLQYRKWGGGTNEIYYSKHDLTQLHRWVTTAHGDSMPVGLFIPFEIAWKAVSQFIETDGKLPTSIAWISSRDLPADAFPDP
jgi:hypothetical protein